MKPKVLILDEPTAGLDPGAHKDILEMIKNIHNREHNIIIFVSHNMADVAELSDKVMVMDHGKLVMMGTPQDVFGKYERLSEIGLSVPPVTEMMRRLKNAGIDVRTDIYDIADAKEELFRVLSKR